MVIRFDVRIRDTNKDTKGSLTRSFATSER